MSLPKPAKKKKSGKTASESLHMDAVAKLGCVVCGSFLHTFAPAAIHHCGTTAGGRKNHFKVIGLCDPGHHKGRERGISFHPYHDEFEKRYGTETELLIKTYKRLDVMGRLEPKAREIYLKME